MSERTGTVWAYCRISTPKQSIERQIRNAKEYCPDCIIVQEVFTGTKFQGRDEFKKLLVTVKPGDTIIFDSVSRMSRDAEQGVECYFNLVDKGVNLVFLKEHHIDSEVYLSNLQDKIPLTGQDEDEIFKGINSYFRRLAARQIRITFDQAQKEVDDLRQRTKEGLVTARLNGKELGRPAGRPRKPTQKEQFIKAAMLKKLKSFGGHLSDAEFISMPHNGIRVSRNTFYKYKKELSEDETDE